MAQKENQRVRLTKTLLKNSLIELMDTKPITKITIKELCECAGLNRSTFYLYYADQYALLDSIVDELLENIQAHLGKIDQSAIGLQYLESLLSYIETNADIFRTLLCRQEGTPFEHRFIDGSLHNLEASLNLSGAVDTSDYIYTYLITGCLHVIKRWINSGFDKPSSDMAALLYELSDHAASPYR